MNTTVYPGVGEGVKCPLRILALVSGSTVFFLQDSGRHGSFGDQVSPDLSGYIQHYIQQSSITLFSCHYVTLALLKPNCWATEEGDGRHSGGGYIHRIFHGSRISFQLPNSSIFSCSCCLAFFWWITGHVIAIVELNAEDLKLTLIVRPLFVV